MMETLLTVLLYAGSIAVIYLVFEAMMCFFDWYDRQ